MGFFSNIRAKQDQKTLDFLNSLLMPQEEINAFHKAGIDWFAITSKRVIVFDSELKLVGDSSNEIVSFRLADVKTVIIEIPLNGVFKKYRLAFRSEALTAKVSFLEKEECLSAYREVLPLIY